MELSFEFFETNKKLAEQNDPIGQFNLGLMYFFGNCVKQDYIKAIDWLLRSANQNYVNAQYQLGAMYFNGDGFTKDYTQALYWFSKAAEQNNASAAYYIGFMYYYGLDIPEDFMKAMEWIFRSARLGDEEGIKFLYEREVSYKLINMSNSGNELCKNYLLKISNKDWS